jgi:drug/metabolite transporter (DMT)-like permease
MSTKELGVLLGLGAIWGASFMFIKVGGEEMQPFALVEMRLALAGLVMVLVCTRVPGIFAAMRANWKPLVVLGLFNCAVPYTLITWGETYISSGLAAIYNACAPLWAAVLGLFWLWGERLSPGRMLGVLIGFAGVVLVVSGDLGETSSRGPEQFIGHAAVLLAALSYAFAGIFGRRMLKGVPSLAPATGQLITGALMLLPLALLQVPQQMPSVTALGAVAILAIAGTALASLMYYWLLARVGATRTLLVTYLLPIFALAWGALSPLNEPITLTAVLGLTLVMLGITITSGRATPVFAWVRSRMGRAAA